MKIVIDKHIPFIQGVLEPYAEVIYASPGDINHDLVLNADALIIRTRTQCNADLLDGTNVKFIATATIGHDHVDAKFCATNHIAWTNSAGCNAHAVAEYVESVLHFFQENRNVRMSGKTLGVVGVGNVGKLIVALAEKYGMQALQCDPPRARLEENVNFVSLQTIAEQADIVTFHTPLTKSGEDKTFHLCDAEFLSSLKSDAILINAARGGIIDENALKQFPQLMSNAVLDCWEHESNIDPELCKQVALSTPHIAGYSLQGKANATTMCVQSLARFFDIHELKNWQLTLPSPNNNRPYDVNADSEVLRSNLSAFERLRSEYPLR